MVVAEISAATLQKTRAFRDYEDGPGGKYRTSQKDYVIRTAGHSDILKDRQVVQMQTGTNLSDEGEDAISWNVRFATQDQFRAANQWWRIEEIQTSPASFVINAGQAKGYWVMSVPPEIIPDHNDIFRPAAIELLAALYRICRPSIQMPAIGKGDRHSARNIHLRCGARSTIIRDYGDQNRSRVSVQQWSSATSEC